jgi:hypothetical protein
MVHGGGGSSLSMSATMSTGSGPGGRRSSSTFERRSGCRSSTDVRLRTSGLGTAATPTGRGSTESAHSEQTSGRSSFAMEQEPAHGWGASNSMDAARPSVESFGFPPSSPGGRSEDAAPAPMTSEQLQGMCTQMGVPPAMHARFLRLAVLHPSLPVPMRALVTVYPPTSAHHCHVRYDFHGR